MSNKSSPRLLKKYYEWYKNKKIDILEFSKLSGVTKENCLKYIEIMENVPNETDKQLQLAHQQYLQYVRTYTADYRKANPEKVQQWRKNAIVNAYKKLIAAEPQYKIKEND